MKYIKKLNIDFNNWEEIDDNRINNEFKDNIDFYNFLLENNILNEFIIGFKDKELKSSMTWKETNLIDYFKKIKDKKYIIYAFNFELYNQKYNIINWNLINRKWKNKLKY